MTLKNGFGKCSLFVLSHILYMFYHIYILSIILNLNMEKALFDWPIVLRYDCNNEVVRIERVSVEVMLHGTICNDDFFAQHSVAMLDQC